MDWPKETFLYILWKLKTVIYYLSASQYMLEAWHSRCDFSLHVSCQKTIKTIYSTTRYKSLWLQVYLVLVIYYSPWWPIKNNKKKVKNSTNQKKDQKKKSTTKTNKQAKQQWQIQQQNPTNKQTKPPSNHTKKRGGGISNYYIMEGLFKINKILQIWYISIFTSASFCF